MLISKISELPNLTADKRFSIDLETRDPNLKQKGPGDIRLDGHIAGIALASEGVPEGLYIPIGHELDYIKKTNTLLSNVGGVAKWLHDTLHRPGLEIVGTNLYYDRGWLEVLGVKLFPDAELLDIQIAEALLEPNANGYSLNKIAERRLNQKKDETEMYDFLSSYFGGRNSRNAQMKNVWRAPSEKVYKYAVSDVTLPLRIMKKQEALIETENLTEVFQLERRIAHIVYYMRKRGVRVDVAKAEQIKEQIEQKAKAARNELGYVSVWASEDLAKLYSRHKIEYPVTPERVGAKGLVVGGKPSFTAEWLIAKAKAGCKLSGLVVDIRKAEKAVNTFLDGAILDTEHKGRIHASIHPLRNDEGGTVSGRFSYSNPNLQQIPSRDPELGHLIRSVFLPEEGDFWVKHDYSQIEPRLTLHYARGREAERIRSRYKEDPLLDCYTTLLDSAPEGTTRPELKVVWLGTLYGMGRARLAQNLNVEASEAALISEAFHKVAPYVKQLSYAVQQAANSRGWIKTLSGRKARFDFWEPSKFELAMKCKPSKDKRDILAWLVKEGEKSGASSLKRAYTYKALNALIQGGAADIMKYAMVKEFESGVWDVLGPPLLTIHDELDRSVPNTKEGLEASAEARNIMTNCIKLKLPLHVDEEVGANWGTLI